MKLFANTAVAALIARAALATPQSAAEINAAQVANLMAINKAASDARATAGAAAGATAGANNRVTVSSANTAKGGAGGSGGSAISAAQGGTGGRATSDQSQAQRQAQRQGQTATGGYANAQQTQGSVTGSQAARTGDVAVSIDQSNRSRIPVATALAPDLIINGGERCYWTFSIVGAAQSATGGGSAGAGLFPTRLPTCMRFVVADRYAAGYCDDPQSD
ncbi:hypothetical protein GW813_13245, partial [bacterium]|nr:hypothetical protein [bacterium]